MSAKIITFPVAPRMTATLPQKPALYIATGGKVVVLPVIRVERSNGEV